MLIAKGTENINKELIIVRGIIPNILNTNIKQNKNLHLIILIKYLIL